MVAPRSARTIRPTAAAGLDPGVGRVGPDATDPHPGDEDRLMQERPEYQPGQRHREDQALCDPARREHDPDECRRDQPVGQRRRHLAFEMRDDRSSVAICVQQALVTHTHWLRTGLW